MRAAAMLLLMLAAGAQAGTLGEMAPVRPNAESVPVTSSVRSLFVVHCAGCHGADGAGTTVGNVPDMRRLGHFLRLPGGREFIVSVPGVMGSGLDDRQVADVTNWLLATLAAGSAPAGQKAYDAEEIRRARAHPLVDVAAARARLVQRARDQGFELD